MKTYLVLLRGINVGGKNILPMAKLKTFLEELGCSNVTTYIQSGNVIVQSKLDAKELTQEIEESLPKKSQLDSDIIKILILTKEQLQAVVKNKPTDFGDHPDKYHSDVIFLININASETMSIFSPREGVDTVWEGDGVIYSQRLSAERTKSRLGRIVGTAPYKSMTIRSWTTTTKLLKMLEEIDGE